MVRNPRVDNICDLPIELLELMMTYISYDEIAKIRSVCRLFDTCSQRLLNRGFNRVEKYHSICFKRVKTQLPRRESERRSHPLARHCDVLSAIETRLSLLGMTYMKYVEMSLCCFIPGKVIDEIYRVLRFIQNNPNPPRVHELLQELRDISSMAMEYFEEKIAPSLKSRLSNTTSGISSVVPSISSCHRSLPSTSSSSAIYPVAPRLVAGDQETNKTHNNLLKQIQTTQNSIKKDLNEMKLKFRDFSAFKRELNALKTKSKDTEKISLEKDQTIAELRAELEDLKRRMNEIDKKSGIKSIKDEQQVQKETKTPKRRSQRCLNSNPKRTRLQSTEEETVSLEESIPDTMVGNVGRRNRKTPQNTRNSRSASKVFEIKTQKVLSKRKPFNDSIATQRQKRIKNK